MPQHEIATLAGGCFWCLEAAFQDLKGVEQVQSGYSGGRVANPSYEAVCTGSTGHAEVVQLTFDPAVVSFRDLLHVFFTIHDPTTLNRQGGDVGTQYRSAVFYHTPEQKAVVEQVIRELEDRSEEHTSELQSRLHLVCRLLLEKKKTTRTYGSDRTTAAAREMPRRNGPSGETRR